jgi:2-polyprenyl-3-methyl-5-hydroxy-6-metoxy-1,4-benzoquinol methylase
LNELKPEKILISCQGEANESFLREINFLFHSLEKYGGKLKNAQKLVCLTGNLDESQKLKLEKLGIHVKKIDTFDDRCVHANKIEVLKSAESFDYDLLLILDTDIIITNDFSDHLDVTKFKAKLEGIDPIGPKKWKSFFHYFGINFPSEHFITHQSNEEIIPFFCSAVIQIPKKFTSILYSSWKQYVQKLLDSYGVLPDVGSAKYYTDEIALSLAIQDKNIPFTLFPLQMNFSTHCKFHPDSHPENIIPILIHHHHRISKFGNIRYSYHDSMNNLIDKITLSVDRSTDPEILIDDLYLKYLKRFADLDGLNHFSNILEQKINTLDEIKEMIKNSPEYNSLQNSLELCVGNKELTINELTDKIPDNLYSEKELVLKIINCSRINLGWFTKHTPRLLEYPWILQQFNNITEKSILEIGSGISPLPIFLAEQGSTVTTLDNSKIVRTIHDDRQTWNEWGFFDYSKINKNISSINNEVENTEFPINSFEYIFSISVIEHIPAIKRRKIWKKISGWLKENGMLILTIDLIKNSNNLFNLDDYWIVDHEKHGTLDELIIELDSVGIMVETNQILRDIPNADVDMAFMTFKKF